MNLYQHWKPESLDLMKTLTSYTAMKDFALAMLEDLPGPIVQVCGPLTTGGRGSFEANVQAFHEAIHWLSNQGKMVFDQRPFEIPIRQLIVARKESGYAYELLAEFYLPIFQSGYIKELYFLPGWESSIGACWEHDQGKLLGIAIFHLPHNFLETG